VLGVWTAWLSGLETSGKECELSLAVAPGSVGVQA
jgi:hypothetical protein